MSPVEESSAPPPSAGPPPLRPFGLVLHHDGRFSHEGAPILNRRLREHFERNVEYLPAEEKFIVRLQHFRGEVEVEEAGFFVRAFEPGSGRIGLPDGSEEVLDPATLSLSPIDGALLCRVKHALAPEGLLARFMHGAHADSVALRYVTPDGRPTERYPANPNGSPDGIAGVTNEDGRFTIMMPHPERVFRTIQLSWHPSDWGEESPWLRLFRNARHWVG